MSSNKSILKSISWLFLMAWRDARSSYKKLMLFVGSIVLGIAAVVSIQSFSEDLKYNIQLQSKALMGADYLIDSRHLPNERVFQIMDSLGGPEAKEVHFSSMGMFLKNSATKLLDIRGIDGSFPIYGELETSPPEAANIYQSEQGALVDATVMKQFGIQNGDSIKLGDLTIPILGSLISAPGSSGMGSAIAPPLYLPYELVEKTGLIQIGSRIEYQYYFKAEEDLDLEEFSRVLGPKLDREDADLDTHIDTGRQLGRRYTNFAIFLNLVAFIALLLGCVGIASSVQIYMREKLQSIAILKCLGSTKGQTFLIYLIQVLFIGLIGGFLGSLGGLLLQKSFPFLFGEFIPFEIVTSFNLKSLLTGLGLGIFMSGLFALFPVLSIWNVSPLRVLRVDEEDNQSSKKTRMLVILIIFLSIYGFAFGLLQNWKFALYFVLGIGLTFLILLGVSAVIIRGVKFFFPTSWSFCARQSLLNLFRPHNQTTILILTIGVGTFLISTLYFTKDMLLAKLSLDEGGNTPNIILLDVQTDQKEKVTAELDKVISSTPIVTMRVHSIKGQTVSEIRKDTSSQVGRWMLNHEFRATYRAKMIDSESIKDGVWVEKQEFDPNEPISISISESVERDGVVKVGDMIEFNVQGVLMKTRVANIRKVDWGRMQLNFSLVFPEGILETAPQFHVLSTNTENDRSSAALQSKLIKKFPNISIIDFRQILGLIESILTKISWVINFMAIFSIFTGIIVLIGAVRTSKYQRIRESVLLRTIGATGSQILKINAYEYLFLGITGSLSGVLISLVASQLLAWQVFDLAFSPSWIPFVILFPGISILVVLIGLSNSSSVLKSPPLQVLRKESV